MYPAIPNASAPSTPIIPPATLVPTFNLIQFNVIFILFFLDLIASFTICEERVEVEVVVEVEVEVHKKTPHHTTPHTGHYSHTQKDN